MDLNQLNLTNPFFFDGLVNSLSLLSPQDLSKLAIINKYFQKTVNHPILWEKIRVQNRIEARPSENMKNFIPGILIQRKLNASLFQKIVDEKITFAKALAEQPCLLSLIDHHGNSLAHYLFGKKVESTYESNKIIEIVNQLNKVDFERQNFNGNTPLHTLALQDNICQINIMKTILLNVIEKDVDFILKNNRNENFFHYLAKFQIQSSNGDKSLVDNLMDSFYQNLLKKFSNQNCDKASAQFESLVNSPDIYGLTPLAVAIRSTNIPLMNAFLKMGATLDFLHSMDLDRWEKAERDPSLTSPIDLRPLTITSAGEPIIDAETLFSNLQILFEARSNLPKNKMSCPEIDKLVLDLINNVEAQLINLDKNSISLPLLAVSTDNLMAIQLLQAKGASFDRNLGSRDSFTAIEASIHLGLADIFFELIKQVRLPKNLSHDDPLIKLLTTECNNSKIIEYFLDEKIIQLTLENGGKMMSEAEHNNNFNMIFALMKQGFMPSFLEKIFNSY